MQNTATTETLRQTNRRCIFQYIFQHDDENLTKQQIAQALNLSLPTVSGNLNDFLEKGLVKYSGTLASTGGRKPRTIALVPDIRFAVGISLMDDSFRIVAVDLKMKQLALRKVRRKFRQDFRYYETLSEDLETFLTDNKLNRKHLLGVGITIPGIIDPEQDKITFAPTLGLHNVPLSEIRQHFSRYPLLIENDANASGFAEVCARGSSQNLVYLSLERGIGGAILLPGSGYSSYKGENGRSGEFGHICIEPGGRLCRCGKRGCLEAYCSASRLSDDLDITLEDFFNMLQSGNEQIAITWNQYCNHLADGLAIIRMVMDCDIVLGGMLAAYLDDELDTIKRLVCERCPFDTDGDFISLDCFKSNSACAGAALHYIVQFFDDF